MKASLESSETANITKSPASEKGRKQGEKKFKMAFSLSASWNSYRHSDGKEMIFEIKKLGFEEVELSFNLTADMVNAVKDMVRDGLIKISSVHNYCPVPDGIPREIALPDY